MIYNITSYRNRPDINARILLAAKARASKTEIMYRAIVEFGRLSKSLESLVHEGLLSENRNPQSYQTTQKGLAYLESRDKSQFLQVYEQL